MKKSVDRNIRYRTPNPSEMCGYKYIHDDTGQAWEIIHVVERGIRTDEECKAEIVRGMLERIERGASPLNDGKTLFFPDDVEYLKQELLRKCEK